MKKLYDVKMTAGAVEKLKERSIKGLDKLSQEELQELLFEMKIEEELEADENLQFVWLKSDLKDICRLPERYGFCLVEELNVYVSIFEENGEYSIYKNYTDFRNRYLVGEYSDICGKYKEFFAERFKQNLKNIIWYNEDNELKRAVDKELYQIAKDEDRKIENYYDEILGDRINDAIAKVYEENEYTTMENQFIFEANSDEELYEEFLQKFEEERQEVWYKIHDEIEIENIEDSSETIDNFGNLVTFYKINISGYVDGKYASAVKTYASMKNVTMVDDFGVIKTYIYVEHF